MLAVPPELVGIPFVAGGRVAAGCDCWGLLRLAMAVILDIQLPRLDPAGQIHDQGWPVHVALIVGRKAMLHTTEGQSSRDGRR